MIARFDLYDFVANLIPGLVFLWCGQMLAGLFGWTLPLDFTGGLAETSILVAIGYISGLLLQGLSQGVVEQRILKPLWGGFPSERWLLPDDDHFSNEYKNRLFALIRERFGVTTDPDLPHNCPPAYARQLRLKKNRELFYLVYHAVGGTSQRPLIFNAQYGLFRGLLTMFALLALVSFSGLAWALVRSPSHLLPFGLWSTVFTLAAAIAYSRCKKRSEDFAQSVYDLLL
ncbi:MAG: hypothetical protein RMJ19_03215, partial [Gemmatales bacterium]|nr:hypothetical protein [Gemmatales bacterium]MDW8174658.1 hypothetical protein [Gemmatales bacterium]